MENTIKRFLYSPEVYKECLNRIEKLTPKSQPQWGSMTVSQMLSHCAEIQEVSNGKDLKNTPFLVKLIKGMIRKMVVNEKPYPKNTKTHPQYKQTTVRDFEAEKKRLFIALDESVNKDKEQAKQLIHPLFGEMSADEKGWSMYKHLDHHLRQFDV